jgi:rhodanese-related sulfurtransferase
MAVPRITREDLKRRLEIAGAEAVGATTEPRPVIVDVRLKYPYEHSTMMLPGAMRMPPGTPFGNLLPRERDIILYDSDPEELVAESTAQALIRSGFRVLVLEGGIAGWVAAKFETDRKPAPQLAVPVSGLSRG